MGRFGERRHVKFTTLNVYLDDMVSREGALKWVGLIRSLVGEGNL